MVTTQQDLLARQLISGGQSFPQTPIPQGFGGTPQGFGAVTPEIIPTTGRQAAPVAPVRAEQLAQGLTGGGVVPSPTPQVSPIVSPAGGALDIQQALAESLLEQSQDRSASPLVRGIASFLGTQQLGKVREGRAEIGRAEGERERRLEELEIRKGEAQIGKFEAEAAKLEREVLGGGDPKEVFKQETVLRKEFTSLSSDYFKQRDGFGRLRSVADGTPAGDLAMIFNFMKINDPTSVVRESEFKTAQDAKAWLGRAEKKGTIVPNNVRTAIQGALDGTLLLPEQREDFLKQANNLFDAANRQHNKRIEEFTGIAKRTGLNVENVAIDLGLAEEEATEEQVEAGQIAETPIPQTTFSPEEIQAELSNRGL